MYNDYKLNRSNRNNKRPERVLEEKFRTKSEKKSTIMMTYKKSSENIKMDAVNKRDGEIILKNPYFPQLEVSLNHRYPLCMSSYHLSSNENLLIPSFPSKNSFDLLYHRNNNFTFKTDLDFFVSFKNRNPITTANISFISFIAQKCALFICLHT